MRIKWRRFRMASSLVCVLLSALVAAGCAAPQFTYVADSSASTYFKVPYGWHKVDDQQLTIELSALSAVYAANNGLWEAGYSAGSATSAADALRVTLTQPFALAFVMPLNSKASNAMSYNLLRDIFLPVTTTARQVAVQHGFPGTNFHLFSDSMVNAGQGVHGVRVIFDYTYPGTRTDTFDKVALTNSTDTMVYVLLVHCLSACYVRHFDEINNVMMSFTVRSP